MILLFLGSWRSTLVVMISIPLAILSSVVVLYFLGETLNTMTLGGLALAVGILVDDSTVTIENTHRLLTEEHQPLPQATLYGAASIAVPTLVSTLAIACVFTSVVFLHGPAKYLFTPLGFAVVFAHAGVLRALADANACHDWPASEGRAPRRGVRYATKLVASLSRQLHARFRAHARRLCRSAGIFAPPTCDRAGGRCCDARSRSYHANICRP
jgi:AcrB/AcrD/AcrF family